MSVISKALSWWAYEPESGFSYLGGFGVQADKQAPNWTCVLQSQDIRRLKHQCGPAIDYLDDLEEEHYENMRHDAETGGDCDLEDDVHLDGEVIDDDC